MTMTNRWLSDLAPLFSQPQGDGAGKSLFDLGAHLRERPYLGPPPDAPPRYQGELSATVPSPTERVGDWARGKAERLWGADRYGQQNIDGMARGLAQLLVLPSLADMAFYSSRGEPGNTILAAAGGIPGAGPLTRKGGKLAMDEASRMARSVEMGYSTDRFWRGDRGGVTPSKFDGNTFFSRDRDTADGVARLGAKEGGPTQAPEFRLNLTKTHDPSNPMTATEYLRFIDAAEKVDGRKLADNLVDMVAPGRDAAWFREFVKHLPGQPVTNPAGTSMYYTLEQLSRNPASVFRHAGYDAIDFGRDVLKFTGEGIRLKDAAFDPAKANSTNIKASIGAAFGLGGAATMTPTDQAFADR